MDIIKKIDNEIEEVRSARQFIDIKLNDLWEKRNRILANQSWIKFFDFSPDGVLIKESKECVPYPYLPTWRIAIPNDFTITINPTLLNIEEVEIREYHLMEVDRTNYPLTKAYCFFYRR